MCTASARAVTEDRRLAPSWSGAGAAQDLARLLISAIPLLSTVESHGWYFGDRRVSARIGAVLANQWR